MFTKTAAFYDAIYSFKDYAAEADELRRLIAAHKRAPGSRLLDVACGTGKHLEYLHTDFDATGIDLDGGLLAVGRQKLPGVSFHQADMRTFDLGQTFEVITCLFGSIAYVQTAENVRAAAANMTRHLVPGGVLIVEPFIPPDFIRPGTVHARFVDEPELKIARMNTSPQVENGVGHFVFHYMVGTPNEIVTFHEQHDLGLFTHEQNLDALRAAGLSVTFDEQGLIGRGLYIGVK